MYAHTKPLQFLLIFFGCCCCCWLSFSFYGINWLFVELISMVSFIRNRIAILPVHAPVCVCVMYAFVCVCVCTKFYNNTIHRTVRDLLHAAVIMLVFDSMEIAKANLHERKKSDRKKKRNMQIGNNIVLDMKSNKIKPN